MVAYEHSGTPRHNSITYARRLEQKIDNKDAEIALLQGRVQALEGVLIDTAKDLEAQAEHLNTSLLDDLVFRLRNATITFHIHPKTRTREE
jgi:hypothetical protein